MRKCKDVRRTQQRQRRLLFILIHFITTFLFNIILERNEHETELNQFEIISVLQSIYLKYIFVPSVVWRCSWLDCQCCAVAGSRFKAVKNSTKSTVISYKSSVIKYCNETHTHAPLFSWLKCSSTRDKRSLSLIWLELENNWRLRCRTITFAKSILERA